MEVATMCVYSFWFGVIHVACQGHLASLIMSSHRLPQVPTQFTNISWNQLQWNVFVPQAWTVRELFPHHKMTTQTWQRHEWKEMGNREKLLSKHKEKIFSCEWSLNFSWTAIFYTSVTTTRTLKCLSFRRKTLTPCRSLEVGCKNVVFSFTDNCGQLGFTSLIMDFQKARSKHPH